MPIKTQRTLRFIVPGLIDPVPYLDQLPATDLPPLPIFSKMLSRGKFFIPATPNNDPSNFYHCLSNAFANEGTLNPTIAIASLSYYCDTKHLSDSVQSKDIRQGKWIMRADPCFLAADRDQLILAQSGSFDLTLSEAQALAAEINHFFQGYSEENFWTLKVASAERWYLISDRPLFIQSIPPENVIGQAIRDYLFSNEQFIEQGASNKRDARHCLALFNEFQMILHQSKINKNRLADKKTPINSLWFWGGGALNDYTQQTDNPIRVENTIIYSQQTFVENLAALSHQNHVKLADNFLLSPYQPETNNTEITYVIDDFMRAIRNKDIFTWVGLLAQFEKNHLMPLSKELKSGHITQIELISPTGRKLVINKRLLNRWWKKVLPYYREL